MNGYRELAKKIGATEILSFRTEPDEYVDNQRVLLLCQIGSITLKQVRSGDKMAFIQGEDLTGLCEIVVFPKVLAESSRYLETDRIVAISGRINTKDDEIKILAEKIVSPDEAESLSASLSRNTNKKTENSEKNINFHSVSKLFLRFPTKGSKMEKRVLALLKIFPGKTPCYFYYIDTEKLFCISGLAAELSPTVYRELCELLGKENVG